MAILRIRTFPDPVLKQKAEPVVKFDAALQTLASDMLETMYDAPGVGLAANQVGVLQRIFVLDVKYQLEDDGLEEEESAAPRRYINQEPMIIVNPELVNPPSSEKQEEILFKEGCLSVPGFSEEVKRQKQVNLKYQDLKGSFHELTADGLLAIAIQHEIDHLNGRLFIDRLSLAKRELIKNRVKRDQKTIPRRSRRHVEL